MTVSDVQLMMLVHQADVERMAKRISTETAAKVISLLSGNSIED